MKVKKSVLWSVLCFLTGFIGVVLALAAVGYAVWRTMGGHSLGETVRFNVLNFKFDVTKTRFIVASAVSAALIVVSVICKSVGKAVYRIHIMGIGTAVCREGIKDLRPSGSRRKEHPGIRQQFRTADQLCHGVGKKQSSGGDHR